MSISIERYVSITSGVTGAQAVAQRELIGLRFSTDPKVPVGSHVVVANADDALNYFGAASDEYKFAVQYFGYTSPPPASKPERLRFAALVDVARPARIYGEDVATTLAEFQAVTAGALTVTLAGVTANLTGVNLSTAVSLADVATAVTTAIAGEFAGSVVSYDALSGTFNLTTGSIGTAKITVTSTALSELLGWGAGAILSPGSAALSPLESLRAAEQVTDSFGSFSFGATLTTSEIVEVARYNASLNLKYMYLQSVTPATAQAVSAAVLSIPSVGLVLNATAGEFKESIPQAIMAATNYSRRSATVNYMYRQVGGMTSDVSTDDGADLYDALRVNFFGNTANASREISFFQKGFLCGGATDALDMGVHANEQWLKAYLTARLLSLQLSLGKIPANNEGRGYVLAQVTDAANLAKFNGTILPGKTLTTAQQIATTQITGDADAWRDVQINGYWADAAVVERTGEAGVTEYVIQYTLVYSKNDVVRKIQGSHNLI